MFKVRYKNTKTIENVYAVQEKGYISGYVTQFLIYMNGWMWKDADCFEPID